MPSQYADYDTDMIELKKKRATVTTKLESYYLYIYIYCVNRWYKLNPKTSLPSDEEINVVATSLGYPFTKVKKFICEKLNISYNSLIGV